MKTININIPDGHVEKITNTDNRVIIEFVKIDKEKEMKEFLAPFLTNLTIVHSEKYSDSVFYKQNGEVLFELYQNGGNRNFYVDYDKIWKVFYNRFKLKYAEIAAFISIEVENALKLRLISQPISNHFNDNKWKTL